MSRSDEHLGAALGDELVMLDAESGNYYLLNEVARFIWARLSTPTSVSDLLVALEGRYGVSPEVCAREVVPFLEHLYAKRLIAVDHT